MKPSVGRIVHYVSRGSADGIFKSECRAAIITEVIEEDDEGRKLHGVVGLAVLNPTGMFFNTPVFHHEVGVTDADSTANDDPGTWHWPERID